MRMIDLMAPRLLPLIPLRAPLEAHHIPYLRPIDPLIVSTTPRYTHTFPSETSRSPRVQTTTCFRDAFGRLAGRLGYNQAFPYMLGLKRKDQSPGREGSLRSGTEFHCAPGGRGLRFQGAKHFSCVLPKRNIWISARQDLFGFMICIAKV
jgi:hypothetical protein